MNKSILFITNELSLSSASIMALQATKALKSGGYSVTVLTYRDGQLKGDFLTNGIKVVVGNSIEDKPESLLAYSRKNFDLVIINTIACASAIKPFINQPIPVFWWIHESKSYLFNFQTYIPQKLSSNFHVYCVSNYTRNFLLQLRPSYEAHVLYNGIEDNFITDNKKILYNPKRFICVSTIYEINGQDLILRAIDKLYNNGITDLEFVFVGQIVSSNIKKELEEYCSKYSFIKAYPVIPHDDVLRLMMSSAALLVPSRDDSCSLVAAEAMMLSKPVVASSCTGIAELITDGRDGFIIESENVDALVDKILLIRANHKKVIDIGKRCQKIYDKYFCLEKFRNSYISIVKSIINQKNRK